MTSHSEVEVPSDPELAAMSREELVELGTRLDGVELVEYGERYEPGSPADKRAERSVARWFLLAGLASVLFTVAFIWWPQGYRGAYSPDEWKYALYTPILGVTMGLAIGGFGMGVISLAKKIVPHEVAVQERHHGMSAEVDRRTLAAEFSDAGHRSGLIKRRGAIKGSLLLAGGGLGLVATVPIIGGMIKNPWAERAESALWVTLWRPVTLSDGSVRKVRLVQSDGTPISPADMEAGGMITVFPGVPGGAKAADSPALLFRLRPDTPVMVRTGQENFGYGDFYAYSKICTHVGCPASLYEQQTYRILCPCHQSQFDVTDGAKPVFGPATRPLPQLPIELDADGFFVASSDFHEAVGPGFWENGKYPAWSSHPKGSPS